MVELPGWFSLFPPGKPTRTQILIQWLRVSGRGSLKSAGACCLVGQVFSLCPRQLLTKVEPTGSPAQPALAHYSSTVTRW